MHLRWWWGFTSQIQLAIVLFPAQHYNYIGVLYLVLFTEKQNYANIHPAGCTQ